MYQRNGREKLAELVELPAPGTPSTPLFLSGEHRAALSYQIAVSDEHWKPEDLAHDLGGSGNAFAIAFFVSPLPVIWTNCSQEGLGNHPLAAAGLRWFSAYEVANSPLITPHPVLNQRHLVFQFEDSTLDIVCEQVLPYCMKGNVATVSATLRELYMTIKK